MKRITFAKAVGAVLEPAGFIKTAKDFWSRDAGDYLDEIDLQVSRDFCNITANLRCEDKVMGDIMDSARLGEGPHDNFFVRVRAPMIVDGLDRWWVRGDPEGPTKVAEAMTTLALPLLEQLHSLEGTKAHLVRMAERRLQRKGVALAITLARLGEYDEALSLLADDAMPYNWRQRPNLQWVENLKRWIVDLKDGAASPY
jgi:hypothetical protein